MDSTKIEEENRSSCFNQIDVKLVSHNVSKKHFLIERVPMLSSSFACNQIYKYEIYFRLTLFYYLSQTLMFNKPTSDSPLSRNIYFARPYLCLTCHVPCSVCLSDLLPFCPDRVSCLQCDQKIE